MLLYAISLPAYIFLLLGTVPPSAGLESFGTWDALISQGLAGILLIETLADQQQWNYQTAKERYKKTGEVPRGEFTKEDLDRGFVVTGLWSWSRHPNFACEQAIWVGIYQWTCVLTDVTVNWTALGAVSLVLLFQGSVAFSESLSAGKYPEYKEYQQRVSKFIPGVGSIFNKGNQQSTPAPVSAPVSTPVSAPVSAPAPTPRRSARKAGKKEL